MGEARPESMERSGEPRQRMSCHGWRRRCAARGRKAREWRRTTVSAVGKAAVLTMGTTVLHSQDYLGSRFPPETLGSPSFRPRWNPNAMRSGRRKRNPSGFQEKESGTNRCRSSVIKLPTKNLVMGQVTILKCEEELKSVTTCDDEKQANIESDIDLDLCSIERLGPELEMVPK
ncbi:PREDICTED: uncharacterized protein LOC104606008 [Nelumbo nucifera]|uniref:Uncharacterized protein LOC104606008 n=2 Tax=Nelumbo nucifera TaxID=4432 RepID=A0A1U8Q7H0_NELNU|nr:PREDICTED: uncharacterized protein LOC104606008 [Nelumbo nucifera]DAD21969.1 TPA_asm: hypothetical protein HUJ06_023432 [Nelumbo nucifera]